MVHYTSVLPALFLLWICCSGYVRSENVTAGNPCNLQEDSVMPSLNSKTQYLKCERKSWKNGTFAEFPKGQWVVANCIVDDVNTCIKAEKEAWHKEKRKEEKFQKFTQNNDVYNCVDSQVLANGPCCYEPGKLLEPDPQDLGSYLQCAPSTYNENGGGTWLKMSCGAGLKFDRLSQTCGTPSFGGETYANSIDASGEYGGYYPYTNNGSTNVQGYTRNGNSNGQVYTINGNTNVQGYRSSDIDYQKQNGSYIGMITVCTVNRCSWNRQCQTPGHWCSASGYCCYNASGTVTSNSRTIGSRPAPKGTRSQMPSCPGPCNQCGAITPVIVQPCITTSQCPTGNYCPYSTGVCCPSGPVYPIIPPVQQRLCPDGAQALSTRCSIDAQCPSGYYCPQSVGACCRQLIRNCPDESPSLMTTCTADNQCPTGFYCPRTTGACCRQSQCPDGTSSLKLPCTGDSACPSGYYCPSGIGMCCKTTQQIRTCPTGQLATTTLCTVDSQCPSGYYCPSVTGACCPRGGVPTRTCPDLTPALTGINCQVDTQCPQGYYCPPTVGGCCLAPTVPTPPPINQCPDGSFPAPQPAQCTQDAQCPPNFVCNLQIGRCCSAPIQPRCPDGSLPLTNPPTCTAGLNQCPQGTACSNGVCCQQPSCPNGQPAAGSCINGLCGLGFSCVTQSNICCPTSVQPTSPPQTMQCPDGSQAVGACINGQCGTGFTCTLASNLCCPVNTPLPPIQPTIPPPTNNICPDGTQAAGACIQGLCGSGFTCTNNLCCRGGAAPQPMTCPDGGSPLGVCVSGSCPAGFTCSLNNLCCAGGVVPTPIGQQCPNGAQNLGQCIGNLCPIGYNCLNNLCCASGGVQPFPTSCPNNAPAVGACINNLCAIGFNCINNLCCADNTVIPVNIATNCPNGAVSNGPCVGGLCSAGFACINGVCCAGNTSPNTCPDGQAGVGACVGGLCGVGFTCFAQANLCCTAGTVAGVGGNIQETVPAGGACNTFNQQSCIGFSTGSANCVNGICTCTRGPTNPGLPCFRRRGVAAKHEQMIPLLFSDAVGSKVFNECYSKENCSASEQCTNGVCVTVKTLGKSCVHRLECTLKCPATTCEKGTKDGSKICVCSPGLYQYGNKCVKRCPSGTRKKTEPRRSCQDTVFSTILHGGEAFQKELKMHDAC